ncbi:MAG TPA: hypothetical protein VJP80_02550 [Candidatus Saccharimonadales bacterium]|nr:hypothetical protein [Candidatus Saccharimonadales bacterium]
MSVFFGPAKPLYDRTMLYALDAEESTMQQPYAELSSAARKEDVQYVRDNSVYTCSVLPSTQPDDVFMLDAAYEAQPQLIQWLRDVYANLGVQFSRHIVYAPPQQFAAKSAELLKARPDLQTVASICYSYNAQRAFPDEQHLAASIRVNAKTTLTNLAKQYGFAIPRSFVTTVAKAASLYDREFAAHQTSVYVKLDGLGGGSNVVRAANRAEVVAVAKLYPGNVSCMLQEAVDRSYFETIHIYHITDTAITYDGSRATMTHDAAWYGNIFDPRIRLNAKQRAMLDAAARAIQQEGYAAREPLLVGFDAFMNPEDILITECNARWLGSTPSEYALRRLGAGVYTSVRAVSTIDGVAEHELPKFMDWVQAHLFDPRRTTSQPYAVLPLGFSGYVDNGERLVSIIIVGDFHACASAIRQAFSSKSFALLDNSARIYDHVMSKMTQS